MCIDVPGIRDGSQIFFHILKPKGKTPTHALAAELHKVPINLFQKGKHNQAISEGEVRCMACEERRTV